MARLELLSAALLVAAVVATPAMAREGHRHLRHHGSPYAAQDYYAGPAPAGAYAAVPYAPGYGYGYGYGYTRSCAPGPRVGAFATQPWDNDPTCPAWWGPGY
jgi:hypothetical protein